MISIVIVNYNGSRYLPECLDSLRCQSLPAHEFEVIVVDNASSDGSCELVRSRYPWVRLVRSSENRGFTGGNALGTESAHGELLYFLNNDTVMDPGALESLSQAARRYAEVFGFVSKLVFHHDPGIINSVGLYPVRDGRGKDRGFRSRDDGSAEAAHEVFGGCGAALMIRRDLLDPKEQVFDPRHFMYYEDLDLAWRMRLRGHGFLYVPCSVVRHIHCGSSGESTPFFTRQVERNRVLTAVKNADPITALFSLLGAFARTAREWLRSVLRHSRAATAKAHTLALFDTLYRLPESWMIRYSRRCRRG